MPNHRKAKGPQPAARARRPLAAKLGLSTPATSDALARILQAARGLMLRLAPAMLMVCLGTGCHLLLSYGPSSTDASHSGSDGSSDGSGTPLLEVGPPDRFWLEAGTADRYSLIADGGSRVGPMVTACKGALGPTLTIPFPPAGEMLLPTEGILVLVAARGNSAAPSVSYGGPIASVFAGIGVHDIFTQMFHRPPGSPAQSAITVTSSPAAVALAACVLAVPGVPQFPDFNSSNATGSSLATGSTDKSCPGLFVDFAAVPASRTLDPSPPQVRNDLPVTVGGTASTLLTMASSRRTALVAGKTSWSISPSAALWHYRAICLQ